MILFLKISQTGKNMTNNEKIKYIEGKSRDLKGRQDSVRKIIGDKHWGEDGRYKELIFVKFWNAGLPQDSYRNNHYSFYNLINRSFGYFILNIKERILLMLCSRNEFSVKDQNGIYLDGGKEGFKILDCNEVNGWCGKRDSIFADFGAESERERANQ